MVLPVGGGDGRLEDLGSGAFPQCLVLCMQPLGDCGVGRVQVVYRFADECFSGHAKKFFPRPVDAKVASLCVLEEDRVRQGFDHLLRHALRRCQARLTAAQVPGNVRGERRSALAGAGERAYQSEQQQADGAPAEQGK